MVKEIQLSYTIQAVTCWWLTFGCLIGFRSQSIFDLYIDVFK